MKIIILHPSMILFYPTDLPKFVPFNYNNPFGYHSLSILSYCILLTFLLNGPKKMYTKIAHKSNGERNGTWKKATMASASHKNFDNLPKKNPDENSSAAVCIIINSFKRERKKTERYKHHPKH